jgi:hypothetical protein
MAQPQPQSPAKNGDVSFLKLLQVETSLTDSVDVCCVNKRSHTSCSFSGVDESMLSECIV